MHSSQWVNDGGWDPGSRGGDGEKWMGGEHVSGMESIRFLNWFKVWGGRAERKKRISGYSWVFIYLRLVNTLKKN